MAYDTNLWDKYTDENEILLRPELSKFIFHLCLALGGKRILEAGCNVGNNLSSFPSNMEIYGIDMNENALEKASKKYPTFTFNQSNIGKTSFPDSHFDIVFTRGVLIHVKSSEIDNALEEFTRISNKWIFNLEYYGEDGKMIDWKRGKDLLWYRNMKERWKKYDVEIISDTEIPEVVDSGKTRLTLVLKK